MARPLNLQGRDSDSAQCWVLGRKEIGVMLATE